MSFLSFASSKNPLQISLKSPQTNNQQQSINNNQQNQYISAVIIIDQTTVCAITQQTLKFFSIPIKQNTMQQKQESPQLIGQITVNKEIKEEFNKFYGIPSQTEAISKQQRSKGYQKSQRKQNNFMKPTIIQEKGVIYDCISKQFFILVSTQLNKYLLRLSINLKQPTTLSQSKHKVSITNLQVVYNFAAPPQIAKYNLQVEPQLLYMQESATVVLIRKFYSDSLVIIFRVHQDNRQTGLVINSLNRNQSTQSQQAYRNLLNKKSSQNKSSNTLIDNCYVHQHIYYWSFYINQECLSLLDNSRYLVNYRQVIAKSHLQIDIIDTFTKDKISLIVRQHILPMTIKHIQLLPGRIIQTFSKEPLVKSSVQNQQKPSSFTIRIFSILTHKQATCIMDYDVVHDIVINVYIMDNVLVERISQYNSQKTYCLVNFLFMDKNYLSLLRKQLVKDNQTKEEISGQLIQDLLNTGVQFKMNKLAWNIQLKMVAQYSISVRNPLIDLKVSKVIDKKTTYLHMLDQLKLKHPLLQNHQFVTQILQFLSDK